jgi:hypothetical protein
MLMETLIDAEVISIVGSLCIEYPGKPSPDIIESGVFVWSSEQEFECSSLPRTETMHVDLVVSNFKIKLVQLVSAQFM